MQELVELRELVLVRQPANDAVAGPTMIERHHQAGKFRRPAPALQLKTERTVPAVGDRTPVFGEIAFRLPDQRAVGEDPERVAFTRGDELGGQALEVRL